MSRRTMTNYVVSCLFGDENNFGIYKAPLAPMVECIFFSNSDKIGRYAKKQGWRFVKTFHPVLSNDYLETSLQSKWVKYLQFLTQDAMLSEKLGKPDSILYFDHKFCLTPEQVSRILEYESGKAVVIRSTPTLKDTISAEIEAAAPYERYQRHLNSTRTFVETEFLRGKRNEVRICNTGLIHYRNLEVSEQLAQKVYDGCVSLKQPECQIIWALQSQQFSDDIHTVRWDDELVGDIVWEDPKQTLNQKETGEKAHSKTVGQGIIISGFHRSGTSSVTGYLHHAGITAGDDLMEAKDDNKKGYFESWGLVKLHDRFMNSKGVDWASSLNEAAPLSASDIDELTKYAELRSSNSAGLWCMKDPRIGRYIFEWKQAVPSLKNLLVYRHPSASVYSLQKRSIRELAQAYGTAELQNRFLQDPDLALKLWVEHNERYLSFFEAHERDTLVVGHAAIMNGFDILSAIEKKFTLDIPSNGAPSGFLVPAMVTPPRPIYVTSKDLRKRAIKVWRTLREIDASLLDASLYPSEESIEEFLILDTESVVPRLNVVEMFSQSAIDEIKALNKQNVYRHQAEKGLIKENQQLKDEKKNFILKVFRLASAQNPRRAYKRYLDYRVLRRSSLFDAEWYLQQNPDVREAQVDPIKHYVRFGAIEGRDPSSSFSTVKYLMENDDVLQIGMNPLLHFEKYGKREGRST